MLSNRNILCISNPMWESDYAKTIVELMRVFALDNKVLYIDNSYTIKEVVVGFAKRKSLPYKRIFGISNRIKEIPLNGGGRVFVLTTPMIFPANFLPSGFLYDSFQKINGLIVTRSIRKALIHLGMEKELVNIVAFNPAMGLVCGRKFNEKCLIYHCYDDIESAEWLGKHGGDAEKRFMRMADLTIVTSKGLLEKKQLLAPKCALVPNAADVQLFQSAFSPNSPRSKRIGYIGSIDSRLDFVLLEYLAETMPDYEFQFIGRVMKADAEKSLSRFPNVQFLGPHPLNDLPGFVKNFSVALIPFVKNQFTQGIYPLKVNEYLAAGVPVVSTDFGFMKDFSEVVSVCSDKNTFRQQILEAILTDDPDKRNDRKNFATNNSWENRVEQIGHLIEQIEKE